MPRVNVYLNFPGDTEDAFNFYRSIFGGEFSSLVRFQDMPMEGVSVPDADQNKLMHVALPIGNDAVLMGTDTLESLGQKLVQGNNIRISLHPESKEEADRMFNALSSGGKVKMPMADQVWGDYHGALTDKFGVHWMVTYSPPR